MSQLHRHNIIRSKLWRPGELMIKRRRPGSLVPVIRFSTGVITYFTRSGVNYVQVIASVGGRFIVPKDLTGAFLAHLAGGGTGGRTAGGGTRAGGGAGGWLEDRRDFTLLAGTYDFTLGAGGVHNGGGNAQGTPGSPSTMAGPLSWSVPGGGYGGGNTAGANDGGPGGNGGGAAGTGTIATTGGVGTPGFEGGNGFMSAGTDKSAGGGAGAGGNGVNGVFNIGGNGGLGVDLDWLEVPKRVCGGGGGVGVTNGTGTDGGQGAGVANQAVLPRDGGGSGGQQGAVSNGGNSWLALRMRADIADIRLG